MSFQKLDALGRTLEALEHALALLGADEATHMAVGGGAKRVEAMTALSGMSPSRDRAPEDADRTGATRRGSRDQGQAGSLFQIRRHYT